MPRDPTLSKRDRKWFMNRGFFDSLREVACQSLRFNKASWVYRKSYARGSVEISAEDPISNRKSVVLENGDQIEQVVELEWKPPVCNTCQSFFLPL